MLRSYYGTTTFIGVDDTFPAAPSVFGKRHKGTEEWYNAYWPHLVMEHTTVTLPSARRFLMHSIFDTNGHVIAISRQLLYFLSGCHALSEGQTFKNGCLYLNHMTGPIVPITETPLKAKLNYIQRLKRKKRTCVRDTCLQCGYAHDAYHTQDLYGCCLCDHCLDRLTVQKGYCYLEDLKTRCQPEFFNRALLPMTRHNVHGFLCGCIFLFKWARKGIHPRQYIRISVSMLSRWYTSILLQPDMEGIHYDLRKYAWGDACLDPHQYQQLMHLTDVAKKAPPATIRAFLSQVTVKKLHCNGFFTERDISFVRKPKQTFLWYSIGYSNTNGLATQTLQTYIPLAPILYYYTRKGTVHT